MLTLWGAPAVRAAASWARTHLRALQNGLTTLVATALLCSLLGHAQLQRLSRNAVVFVWSCCRRARRRPATDGDHGRDGSAPEAARDLPVHTGASSLEESEPLGAGMRAILDALLEIRDG